MSLTKASYSMITGTPVNVVDYATGTGTSGDPYVGWDTAITWAANTEYYFPKGVFSYGTTLNWGFSGIYVCGVGVGSVLNFTGSGKAIDISGGPNNLNDVHLENFLVKGNLNATHGISTYRVVHCIYKNIHVVDVTTYGFSIDFTVCAILENYTCTVNAGLATFLPSTGLYVDATYGGYSTEIIVINPIIEGIAGDGINFQKVIFSKIINGTSEANFVGVRLSSGSGVNSIEGIDCESNTTSDFIIGGTGNVLRGVISGSNIAQSMIITGTRTVLDGCQSTTLINSGIGTNIYDFELVGTSTFLDTGTGTQIQSLYSETETAFIPKTENQNNLFYNGSMESWTAGTSVAPDGWTLTGAGATIAREATIVKHGSYSAAITRSGTNAVFGQTSFYTEIGLPYLKGRQLVIGAWVWASVANVAQVYLTTIASASTSIYHPGDSQWHFLTANIYIPDSATNVVAQILVLNTNTTVYVDAAMLNYGVIPLPYSSKSIAPGNAIGGVGSAGAGNQYVSMIVNGVTYKVLYDN
jgi:hypothetical protein